MKAYAEVRSFVRHQRLGASGKDTDVQGAAIAKPRGATMVMRNVNDLDGSDLVTAWLASLSGADQSAGTRRPQAHALRCQAES